MQYASAIIEQGNGNKVPASHLAQSHSPVNWRYWPTGQDVQAETPTALNMPRAHLEQSEAAEREKSPATQLTQAPE